MKARAAALRLALFTMSFTVTMLGAALAFYTQGPAARGPLPPDHPPVGSAEAASTQLALAANELAGALERDPENGANWTALGRIYLKLALYEPAAKALGRAIALGTTDAELHFQYGEALVYQAGDTVTPDAREAFARTLSLEPSHAGARYFLALHALEAGETEQARAQLAALEKDSPPDAPWRPLVQAALKEAGATGSHPERAAQTP